MGLSQRQRYERPRNLLDVRSVESSREIESNNWTKLTPDGWVACRSYR